MSEAERGGLSNLPPIRVAGPPSEYSDDDSAAEDPLSITIIPLDRGSMGAQDGEVLDEEENRPR